MPSLAADEVSVKEQADIDRTAAVVAHGLLNSMAVICGAATTLRESWDALDRKARDDLLVMIESQGDHVTAMLSDLARGLPAEVVALLDSLRNSRTRS
jgi:K+-sensing histidine kinase KdpD